MSSNQRNSQASMFYPVCYPLRKYQTPRVLGLNRMAITNPFPTPCEQKNLKVMGKLVNVLAAPDKPEPSVNFLDLYIGFREIRQPGLKNLIIEVLEFKSTPSETKALQPDAAGYTSQKSTFILMHNPHHKPQQPTLKAGIFHFNA